MRAQHKNHRHRSSSQATLRIDDGRMTSVDECRATVRTEDGTVIDADEGREAFKSSLPGAFKTTLTCLAVALTLLLSIPVGMLIAKLSILVLHR